MYSCKGFSHFRSLNDFCSPRNTRRLVQTTRGLYSLKSCGGGPGKSARRIQARHQSQCRQGRRTSLSSSRPGQCCRYKPWLWCRTWHPTRWCCKLFLAAATARAFRARVLASCTRTMARDWPTKRTANTASPESHTTAEAQAPRSRSSRVRREVVTTANVRAAYISWSSWCLAVAAAAVAVRQSCQRN